MKIAACIIVKDDSELESLKKAVRSIAGSVDKVFITTTGSVTTEIKKAFTSDKVAHSHFDWNDSFADARNFNFKQTGDEYDFLFWMDSDDIAINAHQLPKIAQLCKENSKDVVFFPYWYICAFNGEPSFQNLADIEMVQMRERLLRPGVTTWKGRLHETPVPVNGTRENYTQIKYHAEPKAENEFSFAIMHTANLSNALEKTARNKRILEIQLEEEKLRREGADPRTIVYLMKIYAEMDDKNDWKKIFDLGEEYLGKSGWDEERGTANEMMGIVAGKMGDYIGAEKYYTEAIREYPHSIIFYLRLCTALFNQKKYDDVEHWLGVASSMDMDKRKSSTPINYKAIKVMFAELLLRLNYEGKKNTKKALEAAKLLYFEHPKSEHLETVKFLEDIDKLNDACKSYDSLAHYLAEIGEHRAIIKTLDALPQGISAQPFAINIRQRFAPARKWDRDEICYFANFNSKHFEQWSANSLEKGIGGSETAVIELAKEWAKMGYRVTVYGDPGEDAGMHEGVNYQPWYMFNPRDSFNIFIQWRGWFLSDKIKARKFLVDLHDIYSPIDIAKEKLRSIDGLMVKSQYHRMLAPQIPDEKFNVISNGIRL